MDDFCMPIQFPKLDTRFEYWYGSDEEQFRKSDIRYIKRHIDNVKFRQIPDMDHGQFVMGYPKEFARQIRKLIV